LQAVGPVPARTYALLGTSDGSLLLASQGGRTITRVDPTSGDVLAQWNLGHGGELAAVEAGGAIWVLHRSKQGTRLVGVEPQTLAIQYERAFASAADGIAAAGGQVWIGVGTSLAAIDPASGSTVARVPLRDRIDRVAGDPDSDLLYVTLEGPVRKDQAPLLELDGSSGGPIADTHAGYADLGGVSHLVPAPDGVWVGEPTGMMGTLGFYAADGLMPPEGFDEGHDGRGVIHGSNSITGAYAGSHLWVAYPDGTVICADARTGRTLGTLTDGSSLWSAAVVTVGDRPMTIVGSTLYAIDEEIACS
jgi:outer membrane protein assembly factor BamB